VEIQKQLDQTPGKHLVIVNYEGVHSFHDEWVYNGADIDGSKVFGHAISARNRMQN